MGANHVRPAPEGKQLKGAAHADGKKNMKLQKQHASAAAPFIKPCGHGAERTRDRPPY